MQVILVMIHVLASLFLIAVILLQAGKGGGLAETFGGGGAGFQNIFGTKTSTFLTRATAVFAVAFLVTSLGLAVLSMKRGGSLLERQVVRDEGQAPAKAATPPKADTPRTPTTDQSKDNINIKEGEKEEARPAEGGEKVPR